MITWGFLQTYLAQGIEHNHGAMAAGTLIGSILLWDILLRGQIGFSVTFLEEIWSRNIGNLLMSPLRPVEFLAALMTMSVLRLVVGLIPVSVLAIWFFGFNLWALGLALAAFFANLILTSWSIGVVVSGLILRNGQGAENVAWTVTFLAVASLRRLLPCRDPAGLVAADRMGSSPDLRVRGHARADGLSHFSERSDARGSSAQHRDLRCGELHIPFVAPQR